jgi:hypothetical protein
MTNKANNKAMSPNESHAAPVAPPVSERRIANPGDAAGSAPQDTTGTAGDPSREDRIREEAYRRFTARNGQAGDSIQDWLDAEAEVDRAPTSE